MSITSTGKRRKLLKNGVDRRKMAFAGVEWRSGVKQRINGVQVAQIGVSYAKNGVDWRSVCLAY